ncbi:MAG: cell envelope integrity protein CreD [Rhodobiaceae bacterium]|nr:cell envelope integrity protein CreD [Rhodobiaceae bacterium]
MSAIDQSSTVRPSLRPSLHSPGVKFFVICGLTLALMIPMLFVWMLIEDRQSYEAQVVQEVAESWGAEQSVAGPFLVVPFRGSFTSTQNGVTTNVSRKDFLIVLPDEMTATVRSEVSLRERAIYEVPVYHADTLIEGRFPARDKIMERLPEGYQPQWGDAFIALRIQDPTGLRDVPGLRLGAAPTPVDFVPSLNLPQSDGYGGLHLSLPDGALDEALPFSVTMAFNGTQSLSFAPVGQTNSVRMTSDWQHPSFGGGYLPDTYVLSADGFEADWSVPYVARSYPQFWRYSDQNISPLFAKAVKVGFVEEADSYQLVSRSAKYAILFLATGFLAVFLLELRAGTRVHAVQYVLFGFGLVIFYVLLLAFAEVTGFGPAYAVASGAVAALNGGYVSAIFGQVRRGAIAALSLLGLYGLLYIILQVAAYALLVGALIAFGVLALTMYATRSVDWSGAIGAPAD